MLPSAYTAENPAFNHVPVIHRRVTDSRKAAIVIHGYSMEKADMEAFGDVLVENGISALQIDLPYHGEHESPDTNGEPLPGSVDAIVDAFRYAYADIHSAAEYLKETGAEEIALVGYSTGAILTLLSLGKSDIFTAGFAAFGGGDIANLIKESPMAEDLRACLGSLDELDAKLAEFEPCNYAENIHPSDLYMVNGRMDPVVPKHYAERFLAHMKSSPQIHWLDADHFDDAVFKHLAQFADAFRNRVAE
jgi:dienelactone hydrolase